MVWHSVVIARNDNPILFFGPKQDGRIGGTQRQINRVADLDHVDCELTGGIVVLNRPP